MIRLRVVLGVALAATAIWLIAALAGTAGSRAALGVGLLMVALAVLLAVRALRPERGVRRFAGVAALAVLAASFAASPLLATPRPRTADQPSAAGDRVAWQNFDRDRIDALVRAGQVVLVDVTADWCLTCKVNKALVLERGAVAETLEQGKIAAVRADWTRPDPAISAYLAGFGRYGIPFDAVYGPGAPTGIALPELLTAQAVLDAVKQAAAAP
jgi:suppressor for copper-sensitivity B